MSRKGHSGEYICALCGKGRSKKTNEKKLFYLHYLLFHLTRKQKRQLLQGFPSFDGKYDKCHPSCYYRFRTFSKHNQFFSPYVTCCICLEDIKNEQEALIPPCHIIEHSLHRDCLTGVPNGCVQCRVGHSAYRNRLRYTRKKLFLESGWTVL